MNFQIKKILLWSLTGRRKEIDLEMNKVNIITGPSRMGKSTILHIINYCLASTRSTIPVGVVSLACKSVGLLIQRGDQELLLVRMMPKVKKATREFNNSCNDFYYDLGERVVIPEVINKFPYSLEQIKKDVLNSYFDIPNEKISEYSQYKPSFRDTIQLNLQPQNIIADPMFLFYKQKTTNNYEDNIADIFQFLIGAKSFADISKKHLIAFYMSEIEKLKRELSLYELEVSRRELEVNSYLEVCKKWNITDYNFKDYDLANKIVTLEKIITNSSAKYLEVKPDLDSTEDNYYIELSQQESELLNNILKIDYDLDLLESYIVSNREAQITQEKLGAIKNISSWVLEQKSTYFFEENLYMEIVNILSREQQQVKEISRIEKIVGKRKNFLIRQKQELLNTLDETRNAIKILEKKSDEARYNYFFNAKINRLIGEIDSFLKRLSDKDVDLKINEKIVSFEHKISLVKEGMKTDEYYQEKTKKIENILSKEMTAIAKFLGAEFTRVYFDIKKLKVQAGNYDLERIGSGANWLAYHLSVFLTIHQYLRKYKKRHVANFLVLDQPTQVYFNNEDSVSLAREESNSSNIKKLFVLLNSSVLYKYQIILLEQAGSKMWENLDNSVCVVDGWSDKDTELIPKSWLLEIYHEYTDKLSELAESSIIDMVDWAQSENLEILDEWQKEYKIIADKFSELDTEVVAL